MKYFDILLLLVFTALPGISGHLCVVSGLPVSLPLVCRVCAKVMFARLGGTGQLDEGIGAWSECVDPSTVFNGLELGALGIWEYGCS